MIWANDKRDLQKSKTTPWSRRPTPPDEPLSTLSVSNGLAERPWLWPYWEPVLEVET
jgi:hypothetical protein